MRRLLAGLLLAAGLTAAAPAYACACGGLVDQPGGDTTARGETAVVVWDGTQETISLRLSTRTDAVTAGLLVPTPAPASVALGDEQVFTDLSTVIAPRKEQRWHLFGPPLLGGGVAAATRRPAHRARASPCCAPSTSDPCGPPPSPRPPRRGWPPG